MLITALSDIHGQLCDIEQCDLLLIAGDICGHKPTRGYAGDSDDLYFQWRWLHTEFKEWLEYIPVVHKVICFGNHDFIAEKRPHSISNLGCKILNGNSITINGLKIWGSPYSLFFHDWAYNSPEFEGEEFLAKHYSSIPNDVDIVISHGPAKGLLDTAPDKKRTGSQALLNKINEVKPMLTIVGHLHDNYNFINMDFGGIYANVALLDNSYVMKNKPMRFETAGREIWRI